MPSTISLSMIESSSFMHHKDQEDTADARYIHVERRTQKNSPKTLAIPSPRNECSAIQWKCYKHQEDKADEVMPMDNREQRLL